jgi:hypothetical protein
VGTSVARTMTTRTSGWLVGRDQLARLFRVFQHLDAGCGQQRHDFFEDAAFGKGEGDHGVVRCEYVEEQKPSKSSSGKAQTTAIAGAIARICNAAWWRLSPAF